MEIRRSLALMLLASCTFAAAQTSTDALHWTRYKERVPLQQDLERIAVQVQSGTVDQVLRTGFPALGITTSQLERHAVKDRVLITVPLRTEQGMYDLVKDLARSPEVEFASPVFVDDLGGPMFLTPYVLASFVGGVSAADQAAILQEQDMERDEEYGALGILRLHVNATNGYAVLDAANAMAQRASIRLSEPDMIFTGTRDLIPNDPLFGDCWGLLNTGQSGGTAGIDMKATQAWDITTGSASIITVVFDSGSEQTHPDLNQVPGNDFTTDASTTGDPVNSFDNHGTAVAGCISSTINNGLGTVGVAPGTKTAAARMCITINSQGNWSSAESWTVNAINWAVTIGARVTNNSNAYGFTGAAMELAYSTTRANGMVHFASAGNSAQNALAYPSSLPTVNAVSAIDRTGALASFSNYNSGLAFCAPGAAVNTTDRTGTAGYSTTDYTVINGTSFSSPYAAGVAALLLSHVPSLNALQVEETMQLTATDLGTPGFDTNFGYGLVNAFAALTQVVAPSDHVCDALPLVVGTNGPFTNVNSSTDPNEFVPPNGACATQSSWCSNADQTVWFEFVAPASGRISINFGSTQDWDSEIALWSAATCSDLYGGPATLLAANDDITGAFPYHAAILPVCVTPGQTYFVQVDGYQSTTNNAFQLVLVEEPAIVWYEDLDGDGAGDPGNTVTSCTAPGGGPWVTNGNDQCPTDPNKIVPGSCGCNAPEPGTLCDDGNPFTDNDVIIAGCTCLGTGYCTPYTGGGDPVWGHWIDGVQMGSIVNTNSGPGPAQQYTYFGPPHTTSLARGATETITITAANGVPTRFGVWIDHNIDGVFDATEKVGEFASTSPGQVTDIIFTLPMGATVGNTVMRVRGVYVFPGEADPIDPCYVYIYSEVEDYLVEITPFLDCENVPDGPALPGTPCDDGNAATYNDTWDANCNCIGLPSFVGVDLKVRLEGPYDPATGLMDDGLRANGLLPLTEPYTAMGYSFVGPPAGTLSPSQLGDNGPMSFVDWVIVELRSMADPTVVVASRAGIVLRNGTVVDAATSQVPMRFEQVLGGDYHVAVRHRNHLGVMSAVAQGMCPVCLPILDLSAPATPVYGTAARKSVSGTFPADLLWSGDATFNGDLKYTGAANDRDPILQSVGGVVPTNTSSGYVREDVNMDGVVRYTGSNNDRDPILQNIGGVVPTNIRLEQMP